ncbi:MAG: hypothetical protein NTX96_02060 [Candidatus Zambryskibacteria bacterium]|nr:hypothetical protein [Candidatus Zambryskibacteria bacterium]
MLKDTPFVITRKFIDDIVSKEEELFKKDLLENYPEDVKNQFDVIEKSVIHTRINGYIVNDSIGRKTRVFDANIFMSAIVKDVRERIINIVLKHTHISPGKILMHTFPLVLFSTIRDNFTNDSDFILMDITSEITDVALVSDDVITKTNSFPFGRNSIIRQIAKVFNVSLEIAESTLHMYMSSKVDDTTRLLMQNLFNDMEKEWEIYFKDMLLALSPNIILPKDVYITADSDVAPIFVDFLKLPKKDITTNFRKNINITHVSKDLLSPFYTNDSKMQEDEFITILAIFYNKLLFL